MRNKSFNSSQLIRISIDAGLAELRSRYIRGKNVLGNDDVRCLFLNAACDAIFQHSSFYRNEKDSYRRYLASCEANDKWKMILNYLLETKCLIPMLQREWDGAYRHYNIGSAIIDHVQTFTEESGSTRHPTGQRKKFVHCLEHSDEEICEAAKILNKRGQQSRIDAIMSLKGQFSKTEAEAILARMDKYESRKTNNKIE